MAGASLLTLIDDITVLLDDVALMTKVAAKKTAGVLGDDLALNAEQVSGVRAERELPVVWAVAVGSLKNKLILVPSALAISALFPWAVVPLLMLGGLYLCLEGVEKLAHSRSKAEHEKDDIADEDAGESDLAALEARKIRGAIRTDFVLSAEIIVIALGTVAGKPFATQVMTLSGIGLIMTAGVYGIVAAIVKLDDLGFYCLKKTTALLRWLGRAILLATPWLMRSLAVAGTAAMFLVGGGILVHGLPGWSLRIEHLAGTLGNGFPATLATGLMNMLVGLAAGAAALLVLKAVGRIRGQGTGGRGQGSGIRDQGSEKPAPLVRRGLPSPIRDQESGVRDQRNPLRR